MAQPPPSSIVYTQFYENSPKLERLRTSNKPATDIEVAFLETEIVPKIQAHIVSVEDQILACKATLNSLTQERRALQAVEKRFCDLKSPRRDFPTEVWLEIFYHSTIEFDTRDGTYAMPDAFGIKSRIWLYGQVCQTWRNILHGRHCASFWSTIYISLPEDLDAQRTCIDRLQYVLQRSGTVSLDVEIADEDEYSTWILEEPQEALRRRLLEVLFAESHRWRTAKLATFAYIESVFPQLEGCLPRLEELKFFHSHRGDGAAEDLPIVHGFSVCPLLWRVQIEGRRRLVDIPWAQITRVTIAGGEEREDDTLWYAGLLKDCVSLKAFSMIDVNMPDLVLAPAEDPLDMITSESIETFHTHSEYFLDHLTLPNAREIILDRDIDLLQAFHNLVLRSDCATKITSLTIKAFATREADTLLPMLISMQNLAKLDITADLKSQMGAAEWVSDSDAIVSLAGIVHLLGLGLGVDPQHTFNFLPSIQDLCIKATNHMEPNFFPYLGQSFELVKSLQARWRPGPAPDSPHAQLRRFHLDVTARAGLSRSVYRPIRHFHEGMALLTRQEVKELRTLSREGLDLCISVKVYESVESRNAAIRLQV